jgi:hypothetical protein
MNQRFSMIYFIVFLACFACVTLWAFIGAVCVLYLDLFGRRYDYENDYHLSKWQIFCAGPIVWYIEFKKK